LYRCEAEWRALLLVIPSTWRRKPIHLTPSSRDSNISTLHIFAYLYAHVRPIHVYILLSLYTYLCLHTSATIYEYIFTSYCASIPKHDTYIYAHVPIVVHILRRLYKYTCLYTSTLTYQYTFTYFFDQKRQIHVYILTCSYPLYVCLHTPTPIYDLYIFTFFYAHIAIHEYILLHSYSNTCLCASTPIYSYMPIYFYGHTCPMHVYMHLQPYIYTRFHTSTATYLYLSTYSYPHIPKHDYILPRPYTN